MTDPKPPTGSDSTEAVEAPTTPLEAPSELPASPSEPAPAPPGEAPSDESPRRKKRKKKKAAEPAAAGPERPELDARGRERPRFLLRFPEDPELEALITAFEAGNYFEVRQQAPRLVGSTTRPEVKAAAEEL